LLFSNVAAHPSGHELPIKQNGATPYHLHKASAGLGTIVNNKRKKIVVVNIDEAITIIIISTIEKNIYFYKKNSYEINLVVGLFLYNHKEELQKGV